MPNDFYKPVVLIAREYLDLIDHDGYSMYIYLCFLTSTKLDNKFSVQQLAEKLNMDTNAVEKTLQKLKICKLISMSGALDERTIKLQKIEIPVEELKKNMVEKFIKKGLVDSSERDKYLERISGSKNKPSPIIKKQSTPTGPVKPLYLNKGIHVNPDTAPALVKYWYAKVDKEFGITTPSKSYNIKHESEKIHSIMKSYKDTADETRKMFDYIIEKAKRQDKYADVSNMNFYSNRRNEAYYSVCVGKKDVKKQAGKFVDKVDHNNLDNVIDEMVGLYRYYVEKGKTKEYVINNIIKKKFNDDNVGEFMKRIEAI